MTLINISVLLCGENLLDHMMQKYKKFNFKKKEMLNCKF